MKILLAVDDSLQAAEAAHALQHLARAEQVVVLHAVELPWPNYPILPESPMIGVKTASELREAADAHMRQEGQRLLTKVRTMLPQDCGTVSTLIETGSPADVILNIAATEHADLIVMGARGRTPVPETAMGSVSHRVVLHASCATLVVGTPFPSLRRVLLPVQGPYDREAAMRFLSRKPFRDGVEITILTVLPAARSIWDEVPPDVETLQVKAVEHARQFVNEAALQVSALGYPAAGVMRLGFAADEIVRESEESAADLLLIGCRAKREQTRFLMGSIAYTVLHRANRPVLIFR